MLRQGAKMLSTTCPQCGAPLFQLKTGETYCPRENREVKLIEEGETIEGIKQEESVEKTFQNKLTLLQRRLDSATEPAEIRELTETITAILDALSKLKSRKP